MDKNELLRLHVIVDLDFLVFRFTSLCHQRPIKKVLFVPGVLLEGPGH